MALSDALAQEFHLEPVRSWIDPHLTLFDCILNTLALIERRSRWEVYQEYLLRNPYNVLRSEVMGMITP